MCAPITMFHLFISHFTVRLYRAFLLSTSIHISVCSNEESHFVPEDQIFLLLTSIHILLYDNGE